MLINSSNYTTILVKTSLKVTLNFKEPRALKFSCFGYLQTKMPIKSSNRVVLFTHIQIKVYGAPIYYSNYFKGSQCNYYNYVYL